RVPTWWARSRAPWCPRSRAPPATRDPRRPENMRRGRAPPAWLVPRNIGSSASRLRLPRAYCACAEPQIARRWKSCSQRIREADVMRSGDPLARDADAGVSAGRSGRRMPGTITMRARRTWWCLVGLLGCSKGSEPTTTTTTAGHEGPEAQASSGVVTGERGASGAGTSAKTSSGGASPEGGTSGDEAPGDEAPGDEAPGDTTRGGEVTGGGTSGGTSQGDEASEVGE